MSSFDKAWNITKESGGYDPATLEQYGIDIDELDEFSGSINGQLSDGSPMEDMGKKVQELHGLLSQATTLAEQCCGEMSEVEDMIVGAQAALNEMHPGSEEEYYGRS